MLNVTYKHKMKSNSYIRTVIVIILAFITLIIFFLSVASAEPKEKVTVYFVIHPALPGINSVLENGIKRYLTSTKENQTKKIEPVYYQGAKLRTLGKNIDEIARGDTVKYIIEIQPEMIERDMVRIYFTLKENGKSYPPWLRIYAKNNLEADLENVVARIRSAIEGEPSKVVFIYCFKGYKVNESSRITTLRTRMLKLLPTKLNEELKNKNLDKKYRASAVELDCTVMNETDILIQKRMYVSDYDYFLDGTITAEDSKLIVTLDVLGRDKSLLPLDEFRPSKSGAENNDIFIAELAKYILSKLAPQ